MTHPDEYDDEEVDNPLQGIFLACLPCILFWALLIALYWTACHD